MKFKLLLLLLLSAGCASIPAHKREAYYGVFPGKEYISLSDFARRYDFKIDFDPFFKTICLTKGENVRIIFAVEAPVALINNRVVLLESDLRVKNGDIQIPSQSIKRVISFMLYGRVKSEAVIHKGRRGTYGIEKIIIDPGHGGKDPGAIGPTGLKEKDVVLNIAKIVKAKLESLGYQVVMTRERDRYISLWRRIYLANKEGADLFISIHANSARYRNAQGFEVYYLAEASDPEARTLAAAENYPLGLSEEISDDVHVQATIWDLLYSENRRDAIQLANKISLSLSRAIGTKNRGVKSANFYVLRGVQMPAVLIEVGFISNRYEEADLKNRGFKNKIAEAIVNGIKSYGKGYAFTEGYK